MSFHQSAAYQKTQPNTLDPAQPLVLQSLERTKKFCLVVKRYAYPAVANPDYQMVFILLGKNPDVAPVW
jgi:hypothetical protein